MCGVVPGVPPRAFTVCPFGARVRYAGGSYQGVLIALVAGWFPGVFGAERWRKRERHQARKKRAPATTAIIAAELVALSPGWPRRLPIQPGRVMAATWPSTALHAAMIGEYLLEDLAKVPAVAEYASEFRYRNPIIEDNTVVVAVSQSGETADTLAALQEAKDRGAMALGVVNVVGSSIARETDAGVFLRVGPEIGVASTKAFTGQVAVLTLITLFLARRKFMSADQCTELLTQLESVPDKIGRILEQDARIRKVAEKYCERENWLFLGRGYNYPTALEGALKLKEISYIHAEGMPAAEMKHGPIALINDGMPAVFIANRGRQYDKVMSNIQEVKSRGGHVIAVATEGDNEIKRYAEDVLYVPDIPEPLSPMLTVVPLQLIAYHAAVLRGHDVDKPRNLAKSVTVE